MQHFPDSKVLAYLGLPATTPAPSSDPINFLRDHLYHLPPHLQLLFSAITTPQQRTTIPAIRNRRLKYTLNIPHQLQFAVAKNTWPELWSGRDQHGQEEGKDEKEWAEKEFLRGEKGHVGKLGALLKEYEEEREADRLRLLRRRQVTAFDEEEEEEEDEDESSDEGENLPAIMDETEEEKIKQFERLIKERFIYGLLKVLLAESNVIIGTECFFAVY
jgi:hypothetical protein